MAKLIIDEEDVVFRQGSFFLLRAIACTAIQDFMGEQAKRGLKARAS